MMVPVRLRNGKMLFKWDAEKRVLQIKQRQDEATLHLNSEGEFEIVEDMAEDDNGPSR